MLQAMDQSEFGQFVAALWEQQGWQTQVKQDDGRAFVAVQRPETGEEGLLWAIPASEGEVGGQQVQQFVKLCRKYGVEESAIVSAGPVSDHAEKVASGTKVELLDGEGIEAFLKRRGLTDLPEQYGGGDGDGGDGASNADESPLDRLEPVAERVGAVAGSVGTKGLAGGVRAKGIVAAVVVVAAIAAVGVLGVPSIPFLGSDDVTAESVAPDDADASLHVTWNAEMTDTIDPNESDDLAYPAPEGHEFVLVRMSINNTGDGRAPLRQAAFKFRVNGTTYANESFADHDGFVDFPMGPGENRVVWTAFTVPEGTTGTLVYDQNATDATVAVEFERDSDLPVDVRER